MSLDVIPATPSRVNTTSDLRSLLGALLITSINNLEPINNRARRRGSERRARSAARPKPGTSATVARTGPANTSGHAQSPGRRSDRWLVDSPTLYSTHESQCRSQWRFSRCHLCPYMPQYAHSRASLVSTSHGAYATRSTHSTLIDRARAFTRPVMQSTQAQLQQAQPQSASACDPVLGCHASRGTLKMQ